MESDDFILISRKKELINIDVHNNDSPNILADLAVANKPFLELLKGIIKTVDEYQKNNDSNKQATDRPTQPKDTKQGEIQDAEVIA